MDLHRAPKRADDRDSPEPIAARRGTKACKEKSLLRGSGGQLKYAVCTPRPLGRGPARVRFRWRTGIDRSALSFVTTSRWPLGLPAGHAGYRFDVVRRLDGAGDRRVAAQPGRAADSPRARSGAGRRSQVHRRIEGRRPGRPPCQPSVRHLLPLVTRTGVRGARPALAGRLRLVRPRRADPGRSPGR